jgi:hypothetical protein
MLRSFRRVSAAPFGEAEELSSLFGRNEGVALKHLFLELRYSQRDSRLSALPFSAAAQKLRRFATHVNVVSIGKSTIVAPGGKIG